MHIRVAFLLTALCGLTLACIEHKDCKTCIQNSRKILWSTQRCQWCPLTNTCHTKGSIFNDCDGNQIIKSESQCRSIADPPMKYDSTLAEELARWSSLAYVDPKSYDKSSIESTVFSQFNGKYQIVEFLTVDCDWILEFDFCSAVIAKSLADDRIIVAFEGTSSPAQIAEQFLLYFFGQENFEPTGGKVLQYNKKTHDSLYLCVKTLLQELLTAMPTAEVMATGHSLGGAQAQLAAAHLVRDGVVSSDKLHVYTFGSPRVGDKDFAYGYDRLLGNSWRVTRKDDPIPLMIPKSGNTISIPNFCYHTRREVYYSGSGIMTSATAHKICMSNEDEDGCSEDAGICLSTNCLTEEHQKYFAQDLPQMMKDRTQKGTTSHDGMRENCRPYSFN